MSRKSKKSPSSNSPPTEILLDECFLLCASGKGCDSTKCPDDAEDRKFYALIALLTANKVKKIPLVLDDGGLIANIYCQKYKFLSRDVQEILVDWLHKCSIKRKPAKIHSAAKEQCNLKEGKLDPLLCQLAVACRGEAPIWTLDSDFWCAMQFHPEIKPTCPEEAMLSVR